MRGRVHAFTCGACGGTLTCDELEATVTCPWCDTDNALTGDDLPRCYSVDPVLDQAEAVRVVRRETSAPTVTRQFSRELRIERKDLLFLPFNALRALRAGRMIVREQRRRPPLEDGTLLRTGMGPSLVEAPEVAGPVVAPRAGGRPELDTKIVLAEILLCEPACDAGDLGARHVRFEHNVFGGEGRPLVPFSRERIASAGDILAPERHPRELRSRLVEAGRDDVGGGRAVEAVGAQLFQIFYPVWVVRGTFAGRSHRFVVDAVDGTMLAGRVPPSPGHRAAVSTAAVVLAAAPLALAARGAVWWAFGDGAGLESGGVVVWLIVLAVQLVALGWGLTVMGWLTGTLLRSRELVFGGGLLQEELVDLPASGPVERLGERLLLAAEKLLVTASRVARHD